MFTFDIYFNNPTKVNRRQNDSKAFNLQDIKSYCKED